MSSIVANDDQIMRELQTEAAKWTMRTFPSRVGKGLDEVEVRLQMKAEAEKWIQYNFEERRQGREGTASPDA